MRAKLTIDASSKYCTDVNEIKGLGFCVSIDHAVYMAMWTQDGGLISCLIKHLIELIVDAIWSFKFLHTYPIYDIIYSVFICIKINLITKDVTKNLQDPDRWIVEAIFRVYEDKKDKLVNKCITISFWGGNAEVPLEEPIITAGKIIYSDISKKDHWDLWSIWYYWTDVDENNVYQPDGKVKVFHSEDCKHIKEAQVFSFPLIDISDDEALMEKVIKPLKAL